MITLNIDLRDEINIDFYFKALAFLAIHDDGLIDEHEKAFILAQGGIYGINAQPYLEARPDWRDVEISAENPSRETALSVVRDGIALGYINGQCSPEQREVLYEVASRLGLKNDDVDAVEGWLKEYWAVLEKGNRLLQGA